MPSYSWMYKDKTDFAILRKKLQVMQTLGVPYTDQEVEQAETSARQEAQVIADGLRAEGANQVKPEQEIVALIAYLQRLGQRNGGAK